MKTHNTILTGRKINYLFHHILKGFKSSHSGLKFIRTELPVPMTDGEYIKWLETNAERLIERIEQFKITNKIISFIFALLFTFMQIVGEGKDMRRARRRKENQSTTTQIAA